MRLLMVIAVALVCAACGPSTRVASSWVDPAYSAGPVQNLAVFVLSANPLTRRVAEDEVVKSLPPGTKGTPSYTLYETLPDDRVAVAALLRERGFDSALVIQLVELKKDEVYTPPSTSYVPVPVYMSNGFGGYYTHAYQQVYSPGYTSTVTTAVVDSALYALSRESPLWMATTNTINAGGGGSGARSVAKTVANEIERRGLFVR